MLLFTLARASLTVNVAAAGGATDGSKRVQPQALTNDNDIIKRRKVDEGHKNFAGKRCCHGGLRRAGRGISG
jgi:hypothetical protein